METTGETIKNCEEFLDSHPTRCRYQYSRSSNKNRFCGRKTHADSKYCSECEKRPHKDSEIREPSCESVKAFVYDEAGYDERGFDYHGFDRMGNVREGNFRE